jgi:succinate-semialdehyde dehydrogenase
MNNEQVAEKLFANARKAFEEFQSYTQEQVDELIKAMCLAFKAEGEAMAVEAVEETGMGDVPSKIGKNVGSPDTVMWATKGKKSMGNIGYDEDPNLALVAHPKGIISNVSPMTNPNITSLFVCCYALKGKNVCIISPHPRGKKSTMHAMRVMSEALDKMGAPKNLIQCVEEPSIELTQLIMSKSNVVVATGGTAMVNAAYSCGHPAFGVGPGNVQGILADDYDNIAQFVGEGIASRGFDNGIVCACTQSFIVPKSREAAVVADLKKQKAYFVDDEKEADKLRKALFPDGHAAAPGLIGKSVHVIAKAAGITIPEDTSIIVVKTDKRGKDDVLCGEKMMPVAVFETYTTFEDGIEATKANLLFAGAGHSCSIHTNDKKRAEYVGTHLPVSRVVVNQPGFFAGNALLKNGLNPTASLGCGSWGNNSISENLTFEHLLNISRVAYLQPEDKLPDASKFYD